MNTTIERRFHLGTKPRRGGGYSCTIRPGEAPPPEPEPEADPAEMVHPLARRMAMAIRCRQLMEAGVAADQAALAAATGMTRAWITIVMRLTLLASDIQEELLHLEPGDAIDQHAVQHIARILSWQEQRKAFSRLRTLHR